MSMIGVGLLLAFGAATSPEIAADESQQLDEIIVSARRVDERLHDVPISVAVLSGARLEDAAVTRWEDLTLPGIKIGPAGITDVLSIRGMASGINFGFEQSAPTFIDGVWFGSSRSSRIGFLDTERVEILKGPQPTYFGKNAIAGAFGIVTRKPAEEFSADVETYREFEHDETTITGVLNVPLGDRFAARLAGRWRDLDGYMTNSADGSSSPHQEDELARLALRWNTTPQWLWMSSRACSPSPATSTNGAPGRAWLATRTRPASGARRPSTWFSNTVLPHPDPPTTATMSRRAISRSMSSRTTRPPKALLNPSTRISMAIAARFSAGR